MSDLFRLVYCSRNAITAQHGTPDDAMAAILAVSRVNNARDRITGAMLYNDGCFVQVLEGPLDAVQQTFERIQCDDRHDEVVVLRSGPVDERLFGLWDMALAESADPAQATETLQRALAHPGGDAGSEVLTLLSGLVRRGGDWSQAAA